MFWTLHAHHGLVRCLQIKRMEMEARSFSADRARSLLVKVKEYKADLAALRTEFKKVSQTCSALPHSAASRLHLWHPPVVRSTCSGRGGDLGLRLMLLACTPLARFKPARLDSQTSPHISFITLLLTLTLALR